VRLCANVRSLRVIIGKSFKRQIIIEPASESEIYVQRCDFTGGHRQKFSRDKNRACGLGIHRESKGNTYLSKLWVCNHDGWKSKLGDGWKSKLGAHWAHRGVCAPPPDVCHVDENENKWLMWIPTPYFSSSLSVISPRVYHCIAALWLTEETSGGGAHARRCASEVHTILFRTGGQTAQLHLLHLM
jgi:hypothetical protein